MNSKLRFRSVAVFIALVGFLPQYSERAQASGRKSPQKKTCIQKLERDLETASQTLGVPVFVEASSLDECVCTQAKEFVRDVNLADREVSRRFRELLKRHEVAQILIRDSESVGSFTRRELRLMTQAGPGYLATNYYGIYRHLQNGFDGNFSTRAKISLDKALELKPLRADSIQDEIIWLYPKVSFLSSSGELASLGYAKQDGIQLEEMIFVDANKPAGELRVKPEHLAFIGGNGTIWQRKSDVVKSHSDKKGVSCGASITASASVARGTFSAF